MKQALSNALHRKHPKRAEGGAGAAPFPENPLNAQGVRVIPAQAGPRSTGRGAPETGPRPERGDSDRPRHPGLQDDGPRWAGRLRPTPPPCIRRSAGPPRPGAAHEAGATCEGPLAAASGAAMRQDGSSAARPTRPARTWAGFSSGGMHGAPRVADGRPAVTRRKARHRIRPRPPHRPGPQEGVRPTPFCRSDQRQRWPMERWTCEGPPAATGAPDAAPAAAERGRGRLTRRPHGAAALHRRSTAVVRPRPAGRGDRTGPNRCSSPDPQGNGGVDTNRLRGLSLIQQIWPD